MNEIIERVAKAICAAVGDDWTREGVEGLGEAYESIARAAIEAMREPTDEMIDAGVSADTGKTLGERVANCHHSMIDKALE